MTPAPAASDPVAATALVYSTVVAAARVDVGWTGSTTPCNPGQISPTATELGQASINTYRALDGLDPIIFDPVLSAKAQEAALITQATGVLNHQPQPGAACATPDGIEAAAHSNLHMGLADASSLIYMDDGGGNNTSVGHRTWILTPITDRMGLGLTGSAGALWVTTPGDANVTFPAWMPWPPAGNVPVVLEPHGRWSLTTSSNTDFSAATVSMSTPAGPLPVSSHGAVSDDTISWEVTLPSLSDLAQPLSVTVTVDHARRGGIDLPPVTWTTDLLPQPRVKSLTPPSIIGIPQSGELLSVKQGRWDQPTEDSSYQWLRDGQPIGSHRSTYRLQQADEGHNIGVNVIASSGQSWLGHRLWSSGLASATLPKTIGAGRLVALAEPTISQKRSRRVLVLHRGRWNLPVTSQTVVWLRDGHAIRGKRGARYRVRGSDAGHRIGALVVTKSEGHGTVRTHLRGIRV